MKFNHLILWYIRCTDIYSMLVLNNKGWRFNRRGVWLDYSTQCWNLTILRLWILLNRQSVGTYWAKISKAICILLFSRRGLMFVYEIIALYFCQMLTDPVESSVLAGIKNYFVTLWYKSSGPCEKVLMTLWSHSVLC